MIIILEENKETLLKKCVECNKLLTKLYALDDHEAKIHIIKMVDQFILDTYEILKDEDIFNCMVVKFIYMKEYMLL